MRFSIAPDWTVIGQQTENLLTEVLEGKLSFTQFFCWDMCNSDLKRRHAACYLTLAMKIHTCTRRISSLTLSRDILNGVSVSSHRGEADPLAVLERFRADFEWSEHNVAFTNLCRIRKDFTKCVRVYFVLSYLIRGWGGTIFIYKWIIK